MEEVRRFRRLRVSTKRVSDGRYGRSRGWEWGGTANGGRFLLWHKMGIGMGETTRTHIFQLAYTSICSISFSPSRALLLWCFDHDDRRQQGELSYFCLPQNCQFKGIRFCQNTDVKVNLRYSFHYSICSYLYLFGPSQFVVSGHHFSMTFLLLTIQSVVCCASVFLAKKLGVISCEF